MVFLDKIWDDVFAGQTPETGLEKLRGKLGPITIKAGEGESSSSSKFQRSISMPPNAATTPVTPVTPSTPNSAKKENVWRSVFHPGSNLATKTIGGQMFDKQLPNSPTVYDWMYSDGTRSKHR